MESDSSCVVRKGIMTSNTNHRESGVLVVVGYVRSGWSPSELSALLGITQAGSAISHPSLISGRHLHHLHCVSYELPGLPPETSH